ncbi:MAG: redoxin domain-containing protein [Planctomycetota bacterium]|nr:redoxin domain-containing protein [Planctomycetota bacterium]
MNIFNTGVDAINHIGAAAWPTLWHAAWQASLLALAALLLAPLLARRPAPLRYGLLVLVLLKFATPPMFALPTGLFSRVGPVVRAPVGMAHASASAAALREAISQGTSPAGNLDAQHDDAASAQNDVASGRAMRGGAPQAAMPADNRHAASPTEPPTGNRPRPLLIPGERGTLDTQRVDTNADASPRGSTLLASAAHPAPKPAALPAQLERQRESLSLAGGVLLVYLLGVCMMALRLAWHWLQLRRLLARAVPADRPDFLAALGAAASHLGIRRRVELLVVDDAISPMALGLLRPRIVLPASMANCTPEETKVILAHELAHHRRGDLWVIWLQVLLRPLWWFNPLFWGIDRSLRSVREECCDDLLLATRLADREGYCQTLLHAAGQWSRALPAAAALGFAQRMHPLGGRMRRIMDPALPRAAQLSRGATLRLVVLALVLLPGLRLASAEETRRVEGPAASSETTKPSKPASDLSGGATTQPTIPTVFKGSVTDKATGQPIEKFSLTVGLASKPGDPVQWLRGPENQPATVMLNPGRFTVSTLPLGRGGALVFLVTAEGYAVAGNAPIAFDGKEHEMAFALVKGKAAEVGATQPATSQTFGPMQPGIPGVKPAQADAAADVPTTQPALPTTFTGKVVDDRTGEPLEQIRVVVGVAAKPGEPIVWLRDPSNVPKVASTGRAPFVSGLAGSAEPSYMPKIVSTGRGTFTVTLGPMKPVGPVVFQVGADGHGMDSISTPIALDGRAHALTFRVGPPQQVVAVPAAQPAANAPATAPAADAPQRQSEPRPAAPAPTYATVRIELRDAAGKPVPGVALAGASPGENSYDVAATDDEGLSLMQVNSKVTNFGVRTSRQGWVPMAVRWSLSEKSPMPAKVSITMEPATTIGGRVVDDAGQPVAGATVNLEVVKTFPNPLQRVDISYETTKTNAQGEWTYPGLPEKCESIRLGALHPNFASGPGWFPMDEFKPMEKLRDRTAVLTLARGVPIVGQVLDEAGSPISKATVGYGRDRVPTNVLPEVVADKEGRFALTCKEGDMAVLTFKAKGFAPTIEEFAMGREKRELAVRLKPAKTLEGTVVDVEGKPIAGARVYLDTWRGARTLNVGLESDAEGKFTYSSAPDDEILIDVYKRGYADNRKFKAVAGAENKVVLLPPTKVKATVVDAATGEPVKGFTVIRGIDFKNGGAVFFQRDNGPSMERANVSDGAFSLELTYPYPAYVLRVEAAGYKPADSEPVALDGKEHALAFRLVKGDSVKVRVDGVDGQPLAGAKAYLVVGGNPLQIANGRIDARMSNSGFAADTDEKGVATFPPQAGAFRVVVADDRGFVNVESKDLLELKSQVVQLKPWGSIHGQLRSGTHPVPNEQIAIHEYISEDPFRDFNAPRVYAYNNLKTDAEGKFQAERVVPGEVTVNRVVVVNDRMHMFTNVTRVKVEPGKTVDVVIGGTGRPVTGRIELPADLLKSGAWVTAMATIMTRAEYPPTPVPVEVQVKGGEAVNAWFMSWRLTPEGKAWMDEQRAFQQRIKNFSFRVGPDGTFSVDGVPPGDYAVSVSFSKPGGNGGFGPAIPSNYLGSAGVDFTMPEIPGGVSDEPLALPPIPFQPVMNLKVGDAAPELKCKTLEGADLSLGDYKGRFVLLNFWATYNPAAKETMADIKAAHEAFAGDKRVAFISVGMDQLQAVTKFYTKENAFTWMQGHLGNPRQIRAAIDRFGAGNMTAALLIGPDGKILARDLKGVAIKEAVGKALEGAPKP